MNLDKEFSEFNDALRGLSLAVHELRKGSLDVRDALAKVVNDSHLRSLMSLQNEDIFFRRLLDVQRYPV